MSTAELERFSADLRGDSSLQEKLAQKGGDLGAIVETARASGYGITLEEVQERIAERGAELSEEELASVAGGRASRINVMVEGGPFLVVHW